VKSSRDVAIRIALFFFVTLAAFTFGTNSFAATPSSASTTLSASSATTLIQFFYAELQTLKAEIAALESASSTVATSSTPATSSPTAQTSTSTPSCTPLTLAISLSLGSTGSDVSSLQEFLESQGYYTYPSITGYFGPVTQGAVEAFQVKNGIVSSGTPETTGYGLVGPKTRAKIAALTSACEPTAVSATSSTSSTTTAASSTATTTPGVIAPVVGGLGGGGGGGGSAPDTTPPTVSITAPAASSTVSGSAVTLTATASDNVAVANVQFGVDGTDIGPAATTSPYTTTWNSTTTTDGVHTLYAVAEDTSGNYATSSESVTVENSAPVISSISSGTPGRTSATVTWTTNQSASSQVYYGTTTAYGASTTLEASLATSHSVILSGLTASTTYHYVVVSTDAVGNTSTSTDQILTTGSTPDTTPPTVSITAPAASSTVSGSAVTLTATASDNVAVANVQFELDGTDIGSAATTSPYTTTWNSTTTTDGAHTLDAVAEDTSGNYATSSESVTVENTPVSISSISSGTPGTASATITWTTNQTASSTIAYGIATSYGSASSSASYLSSHSIILSGLSSGTTYHYQVQSTNVAGDYATSSDQTFTTASVSTPPSGGNIFGMGCSDDEFVNLFKCAGSESGPTGYPAVFDQNGYPNNTMAMPIASSIAEDVSLPLDYCQYPWEIRWSGTMGTNAQPGFKFGAGGVILTVISGNQFVSTATGDGSGTSELDFYGTNGDVIFTIAGCTPANLNAPRNTNSGWRGGASFGTGVAGGSTLSDLQLLPCKSEYPSYDSGTPCSAVETYEAKYDSIGGGFTPTFLTTIEDLHPGWLRTGTNPNFGNTSSLNYRRLPTAFSYTNPIWVPSTWSQNGPAPYGLLTCPNSAGKCTADQLSATLSGVTLTDGTMVQGYLQAATQTSAPCLSLNSGTCYPMTNETQNGGGATFTASISTGGSGGCGAGSTYSGTAGTCMVVTGVSGTLYPNTAIWCTGCTGGLAIVDQASGSTGGAGSYVVSKSLNLPAAYTYASGLAAIPAGDLLTATFDADLQVWQVYNPGTGSSAGLNDGLPIETMIALMNQVNANWWYTIPPYLATDDGSIQTLVNLWLANANPNLKLGLEYCIEEWNAAYDCYGYAFKYAPSFLGSPNPEQNALLWNDDFYACKSSLFFADAISAAGSQSSRIFPILANQYFGGNWNTDQLYRYLGADLCGTACGTSVQNLTYQADVVNNGGINHNTSPYRPVDYGTTSGIAGAPYTQGSLFFYAVTNGYQSQYYLPLTNSYANIAVAANDWTTGDTSAAFNIIDSDLRGSANQLVPSEHTNFFLTSPTLSNYNSAGSAINVNPIGTFTGNTSGASTTVNITNVAAVESTNSGKLYADPVLGTVLAGPGVPTSPPTILTSQVSGPTGGAGTYTTNNAVNFSNETVSYSGSQLENTEQVVENMTYTSGHPVYFIAYEEAPQLTSPRIVDCLLNPSTNGTATALSTSAYTDCINTTGGNGQASVSGYTTSDVLSTTASGLSGVSIPVATVGPDGTPLTAGTLAGSSGCHTASGGSCQVIDTPLSGGSGQGLYATVTVVNGAVTAVAPVTATFWGSISGTTMSVYAANASLAVGQALSGGGVAANTKITSTGTGCNAAAIACYTVSVSQTLATTWPGAEISAVGAGYSSSDVLGSTATGLSGFSWTVSAVNSSGTPTSGTISGGSGGCTTGPCQISTVALSGGSGFNITANLQITNGSLTGVQFLSQVVAQMLLNYEQTSPLFEATERALYSEILAQPSTLTYAQSGLSGYEPNSNPWAIVQGPLNGGSKLLSYNAFCNENGGTNCGP
jgi:hypothetical protein